MEFVQQHVILHNVNTVKNIELGGLFKHDVVMLQIHFYVKPFFRLGGIKKKFEMSSWYKNKSNLI